MYQKLIVGTFALAAFLLAACQSPAATATPAAATPKPATGATTPAPTVAAPTATPAPQIQRGGTLRVGIRCYPGAMTVLRSVFCILPGFAIYDSLLGFDDKGNLQPELAEKWEVAKDGKSVTFKLRSGAKFHDGTDVNAAAVKFNLETMVANKGTLYGDVSIIDSVEVVDNLTAKINLKSPSAAFVAAMAEQAGFLLSPTAYEKYGKTDIERNPVGAGPFAFESALQDDNVTVKRFEQYWDKEKPYLDKIVFKLIPDASVRTVNLKTGNVDHVTEVAYKDVAGLKDLKDMTVYQMVGTGWWWLEMQVTRSPFDNKALRQAIGYAVNPEPIVKSIFYGFTQVAKGSPFGPQSWAYSPDFKGFSYDPAKAKAKLAEGGKPDGFEFSLISYNTEDYAPVIEAVQAQLAAVGIKVVPKLAAAAATTAAATSKDFQMYLGQYTGKLDPDAASVAFHSTGGYNNQAYANPKVDELLEKARQSFDQRERKRYYDEVMPIIIDDAPAYIMLYAPVVAASTNKVQNYKLMPGWYFQYETFKNVWLRR